MYYQMYFSYLQLKFQEFSKVPILFVILTRYHFRNLNTAQKEKVMITSICIKYLKNTMWECKRVNYFFVDIYCTFWYVFLSHHVNDKQKKSQLFIRIFSKSKWSGRLSFSTRLTSNLWKPLQSSRVCETCLRADV